MARSPITNLVNQYNNLNEAEKALFLDLVDPQAEQQAKPKVKRKAGGKSKRAASLATTIKDNLEQRSKEPICTVCGNTENYSDHERASSAYHEFQPAKAAAATGD